MEINANTDEMKSMAVKLRKRCEQYETYIRSLYFEMSKMKTEQAWVGSDQEAFQTAFEERENHYKKIYNLWYKNADILNRLAEMLEQTADSSRA